jgi:hypothetical protein
VLAACLAEAVGKAALLPTVLSGVLAAVLATVLAADLVAWSLGLVLLVPVMGGLLVIAVFFLLPYVALRPPLAAGVLSAVTTACLAEAAAEPALLLLVCVGRWATEHKQAHQERQAPQAQA